MREHPPARSQRSLDDRARANFRNAVPPRPRLQELERLIAKGKLAPEQWYGSAKPTTGKAWLERLPNSFTKGRAP